MINFTGNINDFNNLIKDGNVLVDFYADWCGPCKMVSKELDDIKDSINIIKVNTDNNMELCKKYGVMTIPTLIYFKKNGEFISNIGFISSSDILEFIKK